MRTKELIEKAISKIETERPERHALAARIGELHEQWSDHSGAESDRHATEMAGRCLMLEDLLDEIERGEL